MILTAVCMLATSPVQAQEQTTALSAVMEATPGEEMLTVAQEYALQALLSLAEAKELEATAMEAQMSYGTSLVPLGESAMGISELQEGISSAREAALSVGNLVLDFQGKLDSDRLMDLAVKCGELEKIAQRSALLARQSSLLAEGNMMKAQANVDGKYAALWERAAGMASVERTAWVRATQAGESAAEMLKSVTTALVVAASSSGAEARRNTREQQQALREYVAEDKWINDPVVQVQMLLEQKMDIDEVYVDNVYPVLYFLVRQEEPNLTAMRMLLDAGADPEKSFGGRAPPLKTATVDDKQAAAFLLIEYGADPHREGPGGMAAPCQTIGLNPVFSAAMGCSQVQDQ